jgi:hypothetical protein
VRQVPQLLTQQRLQQQQHQVQQRM